MSSHKTGKQVCNRNILCCSSLRLCFYKACWGELGCERIEYRRSSHQSMKGWEILDLSKAMSRNRKENQKREWRIIMKILEGPGRGFWNFWSFMPPWHSRVSWLYNIMHCCYDQIYVLQVLIYGSKDIIMLIEDKHCMSSPRMEVLSCPHMALKVNLFEKLITIICTL